MSGRRCKALRAWFERKVGRPPYHRAVASRTPLPDGGEAVQMYTSEYRQIKKLWMRGVIRSLAK